MERRPEKNPGCIATDHEIMKIRLLSATDLHQSRHRFHALKNAIERHHPDVLAFGGDVLDAFPLDPGWQISTAESAEFLSRLPVEHIVFIRGNHEDTNWTEFVAAWPHDRRPLHALYGSAYAVGPLVMVGFPCFTGMEFTWCSHLGADTNEMSLAPLKPTTELSVDQNQWLAKLMRQFGPAGRTLWLMHEPPVGFPIGKPETTNAVWTAAVERFSPRLVISGHDHRSPIANNRWHARLGSSLCVNVGQPKDAFHYAITDFEFSTSSPSLPTAIQVQAFPHGERIAL
jgi:Icc-related predicted phosphoesterase